MRILEEQEKRDSLHDVLLELSKSQDILRESKERISFFKRLETIYYNCNEENFRHFYLDIFPALSMKALWLKKMSKGHKIPLPIKGALFKRDTVW